MKVSEVVKEHIAPMFTGDIRLVDVDYEKRNDGMHLVVYIDKPTGVLIEDCVEVSRMIDPVLDELNPTNDETYSLDVSSYGLDKPLKYDWQFKKYTGEKVQVKLYRKVDNRKEFVAKLVARGEKSTQFDLNDEVITVSNADIAYITPYIEF